MDDLLTLPPSRDRAARAYGLDQVAPARPWWLTVGEHRRLAAHLLWGERLSEAICLRLAARLDGPATRLALARQIQDERRHQLLFARYLGLLGGESDDETPFAPAFAAIDAWRGSPAALVVANHVLLENDAVDATALLRSFPCPLLARICRTVLRDEARHVAFGRRLLRHELAHVDAVARRDIYGWARDSGLRVRMPRCTATGALVLFSCGSEGAVLTRCGAASRAASKRPD